MPDAPAAGIAAEVRFVTLDTLPERIGREDRPLVVMPFIDLAPARRSAVQIARRAGTPVSVLGVLDAGRSGFIAVANAAYRRSVAPWFAYVAQDAFAGRGWLAAGLRALEAEEDGGAGGLLAFNDGKWGGALAAFGMVRRAWADGNYAGDLFHPAYRRHYADAELTVLAMQQRRLRHDPAALLVEVDWDKEQAGVAPEDRRLFADRADAGFDGRVADPALSRLFR
ncbi:MAG: hypothetical protein ABW173_11735 [Sphingomonas sp.]